MADRGRRQVTTTGAGGTTTPSPLDLAVDPPPDVVVEIDVSHSSKRKLAFYAQIGVPEIWRCGEPGVFIYHLAGTDYSEAPASLAFPVLRTDMLAGLLLQIKTQGAQSVLEPFRETLRNLPKT